MSDMSDMIGAFIDSRKLENSLHWLIEWAKEKIDKFYDFEETDENKFLRYERNEFKNCPHFELGFLALVFLRQDIARYEKVHNIEICINRLAKLEI